MNDRYCDWNLTELKQELKKRNAKIAGRKSELIDRLVYYDQNNNFNYKEPETVYRMSTPGKENYKDINGDSKVPFVNKTMIDQYLRLNQTVLSEAASLMYDGNFINYIQICGNFVKASVRAAMKKSVRYEVDIRSTDDINECQCECPVGSWPSAHCKHVMVVLLALQDFSRKKEIKIQKTCTDVLQKFHRPTKTFKRSPVKAENITVWPKKSKKELQFQTSQPCSFDAVFNDRFLG